MPHLRIFLSVLWMLWIDIPAMAQGLSLAAALNHAISHNPNVVLAQRQVQSAQGGAQILEGSFDVTFNAQTGFSDSKSYVSGSPNLTTVHSNTQQAGVSKILQNGWQLDIGAIQTLSTTYLEGSSAAPRTDNGTLSFQLRVPLLRNKWGDVSNSLEAAQLESQAARSDLELTLAQALLNTCQAYWDTVAKTQQLEIARSSEQRSRKQLEDTRKLIAADVLPKSDINLAQANLSERVLATHVAEQLMLESRLRLARVLGLDAQASMALSELTDYFPAIFPDANVLQQRKTTWLANALDERADRVSLRLRLDASRLLLSAAEGAQRPQLDFVLGATQNNSLADFRNSASPGTNAQLLALIPLANNSAKGEYRKALAALQSLESRFEELGFVIANRIEISANALLHAAQRIEAAEQAAQTYAISLENERTKRRLGQATFMDVLNLEERYNLSRLAVVAEKQVFANTLVQLRYETGTLLQRDGEHYTARITDLLNADF